MSRSLPFLLTLLACSGEGAGPECATLVQAWADADGDGYGLGAPQAVCTIGRGQADRPFDCDDTDPERHPGVKEQCNGVDDDCDGEIDDGLNNRLFYQDADGDGYGALFPAQLACEATEGWVRDHTDCADDDPTRHPEAPEVCNGGLDDNCNGVADELDPTLDRSSVIRYYEDRDADGYGAFGGKHVDRCAPVPSFVDNAQDCDDHRPEINPLAEEVCDLVDNNCDGLVDGEDPNLAEECPASFVLGSNTDTRFGGADYLRGHIFRAIGTPTVESFALGLTFEGQCQLDYYLQESAQSQGPWTTLYAESVNTPATDGLAYSPPVGLVLTDGMYYHLGVGFLCEADYYADYSGWEGTYGLGEYIGTTLDYSYGGLSNTYQPDSYGNPDYAYHSGYVYQP